MNEELKFLLKWVGWVGARSGVGGGWVGGRGRVGGSGWM